MRAKGLVAQHLSDIIQMPAKLADAAADQAVGLAPVHHDGADGGGIGAHHRPGHIGRDAAPRHDLVIGAPVVAVTRVILGVHDLEFAAGANVQPVAFAALFDHLGATDQDRLFRGVFEDRLRGAQHALILALGKDDAAAGGGGGMEDRPHQQRRFENRRVQLVLVGLHVLDRAGGDAGLHRRLVREVVLKPHQGLLALAVGNCVLLGVLLELLGDGALAVELSAFALRDVARGAPHGGSGTHASEGGIPMVFDGVVGAAGQELGDLAPTVAVDLRNEPVNRKFFATRAVSARTWSLDTLKFLVPPPCRGRAASRRGPRPRRASSRPF